MVIFIKYFLIIRIFFLVFLLLCIIFITVGYNFLRGIIVSEEVGMEHGQGQPRPGPAVL